MRQVAYDVGMNNGDDTAYYLEKGYSVVAVEANPELCSMALERFSDYVHTGRLVICNVGVGPTAGESVFYVDLENHATSTFLRQPNSSGRYRVETVRMRTLSDIMKEHGEPDFLKIDIEGLDFLVLDEIGKSGHLVPHVSVEAHSIDVFCMLICMGYDQFKVVDSMFVADRYSDCEIARLDGTKAHFSFKENSSGPFGDDLPEPWLAKEDGLRSLLTTASSWRDVHAKHTRAAYLAEMKRKGIADADAELRRAFEYWRLFPDVAADHYYGLHGELGFWGARRHFEECGRLEVGRLWPE